MSTTVWSEPTTQSELSAHLRDIEAQLSTVHRDKEELVKLGVYPVEFIEEFFQDAVDNVGACLVATQRLYTIFWYMCIYSICSIVFAEKAKLEWFDFLRCLVRTESDIPKLRLVPGSALKRLQRFPRSSEHEHFIEVDASNVEAVYKSRIFFVSHRWAQSDSPSAASNFPDTEDHQQARLLLDWLDRDYADWDHFYFWVDWACIDQDNSELKARQIEALPIYLRCCTYFVGIAWGDYWKRCWCGLEAIAFGACTAIQPRAASYVPCVSRVG